MNKKIITIAEIVFALVFVVMLAVFMATINSKGNEANNQLSTTLESVTGTSISNYENLEKVKGNIVDNAVKNYDTLSSNNKITVAVQTKDMSGEWAFYGYDAKGNTHPSYNAKNTDSWYINPKSDFMVKVIKNDNDVSVGIAFLQQDTGTFNETDVRNLILSDSKNVKGTKAGQPTIVK